MMTTYLCKFRWLIKIDWIKYKYFYTFSWLHIRLEISLSVKFMANIFVLYRNELHSMELRVNQCITTVRLQLFKKGKYIKCIFVRITNKMD